MDHITLAGHLSPADSFDLADQLSALTATLRPVVTVDLTEVDDLHPSIVSVLVRFRRQARRQGGDVVLLPPAANAAMHTLDQTGLRLVNTRAAAA